jgi:hypothetical protein
MPDSTCVPRKLEVLHAAGQPQKDILALEFRLNVLNITTGFGVWGLVLISNVFIIAAVHELGFRV